MRKLKSGDLVTYQYTHHLNSISTTEIVKCGKYYGDVKHSVNYRGEGQLSIVHFDRNIRSSKVLKKRLKKLCES